MFGLLAVATAHAHLDAGCNKVCHLGGHNSTCLERVKWVKGHVTALDQVVTTVEPELALSCSASWKKVVKDCPSCGQCTLDGLCDYLGFKIGDPVHVLHHDDKWHFGHITAMRPDGKYKVKMKYLPLHLITSNIRRTEEEESQAARGTESIAELHLGARRSAHEVTAFGDGGSFPARGSVVEPFGTRPADEDDMMFAKRRRAIAQKFLEMPQVSPAALGSQALLAGCCGLFLVLVVVGLVGLGRKVCKISQKGCDIDAVLE